LAIIGTLEELSAYIGVIKTEHFDPNTEEKFDIDSSAKLFLYARLTQIQETIIDIEASIGTSRKVLAKYEFTRFSSGEQRIKELENEVDLMSDVNLAQIKESMREKPLQHIPGVSLIEAKLIYARTLCRRAERQLCGAKNLQLGIAPEDMCINYLNKLGDYLLALSIHLLHMQNKEPLKKVTRTNTRAIVQPNLK
jgi:cob(I)alamin adenosyltransferase